jgi:site-specific recombinase XerD
MPLGDVLTLAEYRHLKNNNGPLRNHFNSSYLCTTGVKQRMPKETLQTFLGHRSIRTTEIYANMVDNKKLVSWI